MRPFATTSRAAVGQSRDWSGLSEGQARGGGSRPELASDASSCAGAQRKRTEAAASTSADAALAGISAAGAGAWQEGVQQSFLDLSTGLTGVLPSIEQPGIPLGEAANALAAAGASARLSAQSIEISNRIT